ncbi:MAG TPA: hypothetical protein VGH79_09875 [Gaiellaceae bacterium]|jgi:hypothetical protein
MATKKQRKRSQKERRHEYETVWVDGEGNELDEVPDDQVTPRAKSTNGKKPQQRGKQSSSRALKAPQPPSWRRASKRALMLGAFIFVVMYFLNTSATGAGRVLGAIEISILYTALFIPFTYYADRFGYRRWERKMAEQPKKR